MHRCDRSGGAESRFQSTPLVVEGRCLSAAVRTSPRLCFNPRPSLSKGDASSGSPGRQPRHSFNPRPSLSKGDAYFDRPKVRRMEEFQSTPLVVEGRCKWAKKFHVPFNEFQSTPLVVEGRCSTPVTYWRKRVFSSRCAKLTLFERLDLTRILVVTENDIESSLWLVREPAGKTTCTRVRADSNQSTNGAAKSVALKQPCSRTS